jgi:hypothetical protein
MTYSVILSGDTVFTNGVWIGNRIYWTLTLVTTINYKSLTELHTPAHIKSSSLHLPLLGSVFQLRTFLFLWVSELFPPLATSFSLLTTATLSWLKINHSKLCYDRRSVDQSVLVSSPIWGSRPDFYYYQTFVGLLMWGDLSDERTGLSITIAAGPRQRSHSRIRVPRDSWPYFIVSDSRLPQPGGPGPRIYIP